MQNGSGITFEPYSTKLALQHTRHTVHRVECALAQLAWFVSTDCNTKLYAVITRTLTHDRARRCQIAHDKLEAGYPRFVYLKQVQQLHAKAEQLFGRTGESAMSVPSARVAIRLQKFLLANGCDDANLHDFFAYGVFAVTYSAHYAPTAKMFWQVRTGVIAYGYTHTLRVAWVHCALCACKPWHSSEIPAVIVLTAILHTRTALFMPH